MVVTEGVTVTGFPVVTWVPPQLPVYQYTVPTAPLAVNCVLPPLQIVEFVTETLVGLAGGAFTVMVKVLEKVTV